MSITCNSCGHDNQEDAMYCDECGEQLNTTTDSVVEEQKEEENNYSDSDLNLEEESSTENLVKEDLQEETNPVLSETEAQTEDVEQEDVEQEVISTPLPIGTATRLEFDEPPIQKPIVASPTVLDLPEPPKAILINQETEEKFILSAEEKTVYIGRINEEFPVQIDLSTIDNSDLISRVHAAIHLDNEVYYLEDAGSANGTWLNDTKIQSGSRFRQELTPGDTIAFGRNQTIKLTFDLEESV